jgi:hypothetical protein
MTKKKSKRVYTAQVPDDLPDWVYRIGNVLKLSGLIFSGMNTNYRLYLAGHKHASNKPTVEKMYEPDERLWAEILKRSDDPVYLEGGKKPWLRKAERLVSGYVQQQIWARDGFQCAYCGAEFGKVLMTIDHWMPLELGGANDTTNYISACKRCNKDKGDKHPKNWCQEKDLFYTQYKHYVEKNESSNHPFPWEEIPF